MSSPNDKPLTSLTTSPAELGDRMPLHRPDDPAPVEQPSLSSERLMPDRQQDDNEPSQPTETETNDVDSSSIDAITPDLAASDSNIQKPMLLHRYSTWPHPSQDGMDDVTASTSPSGSQAPSKRNTIDFTTVKNTGERKRTIPAFIKFGTTVDKPRKSLSEAARRFSIMFSGGVVEEECRRLVIDPTAKGPYIDPRTKKPYIRNNITSSRYTIWNFLPNQLMAQFKKVANVYFLFVAALQMVPGWSPTGQYTTILPLAIFMSIAMLHEGFDDYRRHKQDAVENNKECDVLRIYRMNDGDGDASGKRLGVWIKKKWRDLAIGDFVKVKTQEWIPADLILLRSEGEGGIGYVETAALDGETNLKQKQALKETNDVLVSPDALANFKAEITTEHPNQDLYNFDGSLELPDGKKHALSTSQVLLRGTILRNTPEVYGLVIFTGEETKLRMNASKNIRTKAPAIQRLMNQVVIIVFGFVIFLAGLCTFLEHVWQMNIGKDLWYIAPNRQFTTTLFGFVILFNTMIPISLYVTMEIVKLAQAFFINNDHDMYRESTDTPAEARTSTINEDLGQVSYVFTDKTGTLTDNIMLFRKMSVGGRSFFHDLDIRRLEEAELLRMMRNPPKKQRWGRFSIASVASAMRKPREGSSKGSRKHERSDSVRSNFSMIAATDPEAMASPIYRRGSVTSLKSSGDGAGQSTLDLLTIIQHQSHTPFGQAARFFLLAIALCHTCVPEADEENGDIFYQAPSPDEFALVTAAKELGYIVMDRSMSTVSLCINNDGANGLNSPNLETASHETYSILNVIEFSSKRKRMTVIYRMPDGRICALCKGADSIIAERLKRQSMATKRVFINKKDDYKPGVGNRVPSKADAPARSILRVDTSIARTPDFTASPVPKGDSPLSTRSPAPVERRRSWKQGGDEVDEKADLFPIYDEAWEFNQTMYHIQDFATEGLRTLLYGHRFLEEDEYEKWNARYQEASTSLVDRQKKLEEVGEEIEHDFELTGATAIEDKLQCGVPETIDKLRRANIKIWMLTGDKRETAINIGHSCSLIKDYSTTIIIDLHDDLRGLLRQALEDVQSGKIVHAVAIVDGETLMAIEQDEQLLPIFVDLGILCDAVICCRASPCQKALVVRSVREKLNNTVTLAIGDGANDIAMIQEAHVGIGITGREGLQAARSSDYSIARFRFLRNLLFIHGRWSYIRVAKFVLGTFYKCVCFYLTQGIFQYFTGFSGTSLYEQWTLSFYNTLFSSLPVLVIGMFEKDLKKKTLLAVPELYRMGQRNGAFTLRIFFTWMAAGVAQAFVILLIPFFLHSYYGGYELRVTGTPQLYEIGLVVYTSVVHVVTIKIAYLECHNWTWVTHISSLLTLFGWFLYQTIYSFIYPTKSRAAAYDVNGVFQRAGQEPQFWLTVIVTISFAIMPNYVAKAIRAAIAPTDVDTYQQIEKDRDLLKRIIGAGHAASGGEVLNSPVTERPPEQKAQKDRSIDDAQPALESGVLPHDDSEGSDATRANSHDGNDQDDPAIPGIKHIPPTPAPLPDDEQPFDDAFSMGSSTTARSRGDSMEITVEDSERRRSGSMEISVVRDDDGERTSR